MTKPKIVAGRLQNIGKSHIDIWMRKGSKMLKKKKKEDSKYFKLRVVDKKHGVWIIEDGQAITLLDKRDY